MPKPVAKQDLPLTVSESPMTTRSKKATPNSGISPDTEELLHGAFMRCRAKRQQNITIDHLLLALAECDRLSVFWDVFRVNAKSLAKQLSQYVDETTPVAEFSKEEIDVEPTIAFQRVVQRAILHVQSSGKPEVEPINLLIALFGEKDSHATGTLSRLGISRLDVVNYYAHGVPPSVEHIDTSEVGSEQFIRQEVARMDDLKPHRATVPPSPPKLFISYSHVDSACLDRLLVHLRPLHKSEAIACWSDKSIRTGDKWRKEIRHNLDNAAIAILLVSADFLASDFIVNDELPPLLVKAETQGIRILPVILKPCGFLRDTVLSSFQAVNDPSRPLLGLSHIEQEAIYNRIADEVSEEIRSKSAGR